MTLKEDLKEWEEFDVAQFKLAQHLGLLPQGEWKDVVLNGHRKYIFWSDNRLGNLLSEMLIDMIEGRFIEWDEDKNLVRWK